MNNLLSVCTKIGMVCLAITNFFLFKNRPYCYRTGENRDVLLTTCINIEVIISKKKKICSQFKEIAYFKIFNLIKNKIFLFACKIYTEYYFAVNYCDDIRRLSLQNEYFAHNPD